MPADARRETPRLGAADGSLALEDIVQQYGGAAPDTMRRTLVNLEFERGIFLAWTDAQGALVYLQLYQFHFEREAGYWTGAMAINVILGRRANLGIQRERYQEGDEVFETVSAKPVTPELGMDFETAIGRLPKGARQVFVLHDVEGYRHEEFASLLGVTTGTTKAQLHRARMLLRTHLEK